jgi:hypothetical protein
VYNELVVHLDSVIDDINARLNSTFPAFSEFNNTDHPQYPDYNFFPDKYIRSVIVPGAAYKFYVMDAEASTSAPEYQKEYYTNLFYMERDYLELVPEEFQAQEKQGLLTGTEEEERGVWIPSGSIY